MEMGFILAQLDLQGTGTPFLVRKLAQDRH